MEGESMYKIFLKNVHLKITSFFLISLILIPILPYKPFPSIKNIIKYDSIKVTYSSQDGYVPKKEYPDLGIKKDVNLYNFFTIYSWDKLDSKITVVEKGASGGNLTFYINTIENSKENKKFELVDWFSINIPIYNSIIWDSKIKYFYKIILIPSIILLIFTISKLKK